MPEQRSVIAKILPYTTVLLIVVALWVGWIFYSRWRDQKALIDAQQRRKAEFDKKIVQMYGNGELKILTFYGSPAVVAPGTRALLCYGVSNAVSVTIVPDVEPVNPSISRCLEVHPRKSTTYTLTARDAAGHTASQTAEIKIGR